MPNRDHLIAEQKSFIDMVTAQLEERDQQLKVEQARRLQVESDNRRMWEMLYGTDLERNYREGSE